MKKRPAASTNPLPPPAPIEHPFRSIRSCSKCISKKSKCRPALPYCEPCWSSGRTEECDIEEHIVLPYSAAKAREVGDDERRRRVEWLEGELRTRTGSDVAGTSTGTRLTEPIRELGRVPVDPLSLELGLLALDSAGAPSRPPLYGPSPPLLITCRCANSPSLLSTSRNCEWIDHYSLAFGRASAKFSGRTCGRERFGGLDRSDRSESFLVERNRVCAYADSTRQRAPAFRLAKSLVRT